MAKQTRGRPKEPPKVLIRVVIPKTLFVKLSALIDGTGIPFAWICETALDEFLATPRAKIIETLTKKEGK